MTRRLLTMLSAMFLGACVFVGAATNSEPYLASDSLVGLDDHGVLHYDRISVSIVPDNEARIIGGVGVVVPIVPLPLGGKPHRTDQAFQVVVKFETELSGFTFTPSETEIHYNDEVFAATRTTALRARTHRSTGSKLTVPGHRWSCGFPPPVFESTESGEAIALSLGCVTLEFPIDTIDPTESFAVNLGGIRFQGEPIPAVEVRFRHDTRGMFELGIQ